MSELKRKQQRGFGRRILTDSTAVFRLKDIESRLESEASAPAVAPPPIPATTDPEIEVRTQDAVLPDTGAGLVDLNSFETTASVADSEPSTVSPALAKKIVFFASKGGVGATVITTHIAGALSALGHRVCIVDMDLQMGGTAFALGMQTTRSLANLAQAVKIGAEAVSDFPIAQHSSGVYLLDQPDLVEIEQVGPDGLPNVLRALSGIFDFVLIDGLRDFGDHSIVTMDEADQIILVANDDVPSLRCGLRATDLFRRLGYPSDRLKLLLNRNNEPDDVFLEAVTQAFGRDIDWSVPEYADMATCLNDGVLMSHVDPKNEANILFENIARDLAGLPRVEPPKKGFFRRLFKKGGA
ncbi:MAG: AAA family ATPase [Myxococcota bacterium]|nr:AAA family ATPase [Myxococcota bacterium]